MIVGQIHANDDEPAKLYYRKLPNHEQGSVFLAHETNGGDEKIYPLVGTNVPGYYTQDGEVVEPKDGITLGEKWGYQNQSGWQQVNRNGSPRWQERRCPSRRYDR